MENVGEENCWVRVDIVLDYNRWFEISKISISKISISKDYVYLEI